MMSSTKKLVTVTSTLMLVSGSILAVLWTHPLLLFLSIGLIVGGIVLFLYYCTNSVAHWADDVVSGTTTDVHWSESYGWDEDSKK